MKAYTTRVGEGPLPTENAEIADMLHGMGREFGATTGRARRCGWFDSVATRHATMVNGIDDLAVTNLDGLDTVETIKVCVAYRLDGEILDVPPSDAAQWTRCEPVYLEMPGWKRPTEKVKKFADLPNEAKSYVRRLAELTGSRLVDGECRSGAQPDALPVGSWPRRTKRSRATSPSSWMATAAGRRSAGCPESRATKKGRRRCAPASKAAASSGSSSSRSTPSRRKTGSVRRTKSLR